MGAKGVLIVPSQSGRMWIGPKPVYRIVLDEMRRVRGIDSIVACNFSGEPLKNLDVDVIDMPRSCLGISVQEVYGDVLKQGLGETLLCCHACTPFLSASVMEQCVGAVLGGKAVSQTVVEYKFVSSESGDAKGRLTCRNGYVPVFGARAFRASLLSVSDKLGTAEAGNFLPVLVTKRQGLTLSDDADLELIEALEHFGSV
jgi:hypothetical protein